MRAILSARSVRLHTLERRDGMYDNLRALMGSKGISIDALANLLGVHRNTVASKLNGESEFTFGQAELILDTMFPEYTFRYVFHRKTTE